MKKIIDWIKRKLFNFIVNLSFALRKTEVQTLTQTGGSKGEGIGAEQQVNENRVSKALLKGEVTQEVKQLRYRTYKVDEEAKEHEYYSPMKSIKRDKQDNRHIKYKKLEGCKLILIQPNKPEGESVFESIQKFESKDREPQQYTIHIKRNCTPRFRIEEYVKRLALFEREDGVTIADFYISKYPDPSEFKAKAFIREVKGIVESGRTTDLTDFTSFSFETYKCYNSEDYQEYKIKKCTLEGFDEYDGNYIFRYITKEPIEVTNNRLSNKFYDRHMDEKYKNKEAKKVEIDFNPYTSLNKKEYTCTKCGRTFVYDLEEMDAEEPHEARDIDDENENEKEVTSFLDMQMTEQATGMRLCKDCLQKEYERLVAGMAANKE